MQSYSVIPKEIFLSRLRIAAIMAAFVIAGTGFGVDSNKSLLLACALGANFAIMALGLIELYERSLLLSPAMPFFFNISYYSFGNIGALAIPESWLGGNPGSLEYYPIVAPLTTLGLTVYIWLFFKLLGPREQPTKTSSPLQRGARVEDFEIKITGMIFTVSLSIMILGYLSANYNFIGGYFRGLDSQFDRFLAGMMYSFLFLGGFITIRNIAAQQRLIFKAMGFFVLAILLLIQITLRSRTTMLFLVFCFATAWLTIRSKQFFQTIIIGMAVASVIFFAGTVVKIYSVVYATSSLKENLNVVLSIDEKDTLEIKRKSFMMELRRTAGLEMPATLLAGYANGATPMMGQGLVEAAKAFPPAFIRSEGEYSERLAIYDHFYPYGLLFSDVAGIAISTGLAEFGYLGIMPIYALLATWHVLMWRTARRTPLLYLSYLAHMPILISIDLVWDGIFDSLRLWLLLYGVLWLAQPILFRGVRWRPALSAQQG